jgi:lipoprotein LprG
MHTWTPDLLTTARRTAVAGAALALALTTAACTGEESATESKDAAELLSGGVDQLRATEGLTLDLSTESLPEGVSGITAARGVTNDSPAFEGSITVRMSGVAAEVPVVSVDGTVYATLPFTSAFQEVDPTEYGAPDPALLVTPDSGFPVLLENTDAAERGDAFRGGKDNAEELTPVTGTVSGDLMKQIIPSVADTDTFDVEWGFADSGELRTAELTGVFYADSEEMTYTVDFTGYGEAAEITAP